MKLNDYMEFPFVLNMNNYMNGYEGIPNKLSEVTDPSYFNEAPKPVKKQMFANLPSVPPPPPVTAAMRKSTKKTGKAGKAGPSSQTKDFIAQMRKQKKEQKPDE